MHAGARANAAFWIMPDQGARVLALGMGCVDLVELPQILVVGELVGIILDSEREAGEASIAERFQPLLFSECASLPILAR